MVNKTKVSKELEERINFLKFKLVTRIAYIRQDLSEGKVFSAMERLIELQKEFNKLFPFRYGSEMDERGYSDKKVYLGK